MESPHICQPCKGFFCILINNKMSKDVISITLGTYLNAYILHISLTLTKISLDEQVGNMLTCQVFQIWEIYSDLTPVLSELHWLPVEHHLAFKTVPSLVYKYLHSGLPQYFDPYLQLWLQHKTLSKCLKVPN